ncbi:uncharacterized protein ACO6RY_16822 [Pungitius sinensis]
MLLLKQIPQVLSIAKTAESSQSSDDHIEHRGHTVWEVQVSPVGPNQAELADLDPVQGASKAPTSEHGPVTSNGAAWLV